MTLDNAFLISQPNLYEEFQTKSEGLNVSGALRIASGLAPEFYWGTDAARTVHGWYPSGALSRPRSVVFWPAPTWRTSFGLACAATMAKRRSSSPTPCNKAFPGNGWHTTSRVVSPRTVSLLCSPYNRRANDRPKSMDDEVKAIPEKLVSLATGGSSSPCPA
jgi:hypothetical protein